MDERMNAFIQRTEQNGTAIVGVLETLAAINDNMQAAQQQHIGGGGHRRRGKDLKPPKYKGGDESLSWETFKAQWRTYAGLRYGGQPTAEDIAEMKASLFCSIGGVASQLLTGLGPTTAAFDGAATLDDYLAELTAVFRPATEVSLAKQKFRARKQHQQESVQVYHSIKKRLYECAYPVDFLAGRHDQFIESFIDGLANDSVFERVKDQGPHANPQAVLDSALKAVATQRLAVAQGRKKDVGGLGTTVFQVDGDEPQLGLKGNKYDSAEKMDLSLINQINAEVANLFEDDPDTAADIVAEHLSQLQLTGSFDGSCWTCNQYGHSSRYCPRKGNRPPIRRGGGARFRPRGAAASSRGPRRGGRPTGTSLPRARNGQFLPAGVYTKKTINQFFADDRDEGGDEEVGETEEGDRSDEGEETDDEEGGAGAGATAN